jgi:serine/threonine protein kinase
MDTLAYERATKREIEGTVLSGTYRIERRLGRGGMGDVYLASHARLPGRFAVKILLAELIGNQEAFARFCREAEIMSQLRHPNIVQIFDFDTAPDGRPFFVMEHLEGRDLETRLAEDASLPLPMVVRIVGAVGSALAAAHGHGVVHRDLKPANVFLASVDGQTDEIVKVLDFGISKVQSAARLSGSKDLLGTPPYMAPEQARGHHDSVDGRTDQFALGAMAFRMLTGRDPFQGESPAALLYQVVHESPPRLSSLLPSGWDPRPLQEVLDRALAKRPEDRWGGMMEFARAFEAAAERTMVANDVSPEPRPEPEILDTPPPVRLRLVSHGTEGTPWPTPYTRSETDTRRGRTSSARPSPSREVRNPSEGSEFDDRRGRTSSARPSPSREVRNPSEGSEFDDRRGRTSSARPSPSDSELDAPAPARSAALAPRPETPVPSWVTSPAEDWSLPTGIDRVPRRWGAIGAVFVLALAGVAIATGWYHRLPGVFHGAREMIRARFGS